MTENKRFTFTQDTLAKADVFDGNEFVCCTLSVWVEQLVDLLNQLNDDNERLKNMVRHNYVEHKRCVNNYVDKIKEVEKENEQLKLVVKEVIELLSEEVDVFSDKATEHDINAYIELKELDNKDAYYMATATKKSIKLLKRVVND